MNSQTNTDPQVHAGPQVNTAAPLNYTVGDREEDGNKAGIRAVFDRLHRSGLDGFTLTASGIPIHPIKGYAVGIKECADINEALNHAYGGNLIGFWRGDDGREYIDIVRVTLTLFRAVVLAILHEQDCLYCFDTREVIYL